MPAQRARSASTRWISISRKAGTGPSEEGLDAGDRQVGLHRGRQRCLGHASQPRVFKLRGCIDGARPLRIVGDLRGYLRQYDVAPRKVEGGGRADRTGPVDNPWTIRRHHTVVGVEVAVTKAVARPQALDQDKDARGNALGNSAAGEL